MKTLTKHFFIILISTLSILPAYSSGSSRGIKVTTEQGEELSLYKEYHALVVGVGDYNAGWPDLPGAVKDCKEVASFLEEYGFTVKMLQDPSSKER